MFPYVCLATMPLFCEETWPRKIQKVFTGSTTELHPHRSCLYDKEDLGHHKNSELGTNIEWKHRIVTILLLTHCGLQGFLPYSHFITKGYNNWTKGLYGYSWDMMVHSWDTVLVVVKVVDNDSEQEHFIDPHAWTLNDRWNKHADMCLQYARCLKRNLVSTSEADRSLVPVHDKVSKSMSENISVYIDVWCSLNGRFQQRMYDTNYDLLKARWSPFEPVEWLLPLLSSHSSFRERMTAISNEVFSWSNYSDVLFIADFPGMYLENYVSEDLSNVSLTVIEGEVIYETENDRTATSFGVKLKKSFPYPVEVGIFHKIHTIGGVPSCYMYTFLNKTNDKPSLNRQNTLDIKQRMYSPFPLIEDVPDRIEKFSSLIKHIMNGILYFLFG